MKAQKPTKGVRPQLEGVAGVIVNEAPPDIVWGGKHRISPYDALLQELKKAGIGNYLKFGDPRCRPSVTARAKKLGIAVLFGEGPDKSLWVTLQKPELSKNGSVDPEPPKPTNAELVIKAIEAKRHTAGEIVSWLRSNGGAGIGITQVDGLLSNLLRSGKVKLGRQSSEGADRWELVK